MPPAEINHDLEGTGMGKGNASRLCALVLGKGHCLEMRLVKS